MRALKSFTCPDNALNYDPIDDKPSVNAQTCMFPLSDANDLKSASLSSSIVEKYLSRLLMYQSCLYVSGSSGFPPSYEYLEDDLAKY